MVDADFGTAQAGEVFLSLVCAGAVEAVGLLMVDALHFETFMKHGLKETEAGITMKLKRGTFSATFLLACVAAMELEGVVLEEI
jgi:hypothetical protein